MRRKSARLDKEMIQVTILSRQDCHLCDVAINAARRLQTEFPFCLSQVDIANDERLSALYSARIPVIFIDQIETFSGKVTERELRRAIKRARWRRPISRILFHLRQWLRRR
jgi:glutaredoxin